MINSKYLILILGVILLILLYLYRCTTNNKNNKISKYNNGNSVNKSNNLIGGETISLLNIDQVFENSNPVIKSGVLDTLFNYNNFELHFTLGREILFVTDMSGGVLTIGSNSNNYHNLIIHLKKKELIVSLLGYNTHLSFNLSILKSATKIDFTLEYIYPYINIYIVGYDVDNNVINEGFINYSGLLESERNNNFRLYLHPFKNAFSSFGTTSFIEDGNNVSEAIGILKNEECYITNIKIKHTERLQDEIYSNSSVNTNKTYKTLNSDDR